MKIKHFFIFLILLSSTKSMGQVVNLNYGLAKTNVRRDQLLGLDSSNASLNQWVNYQKDDSVSSYKYLFGTEILRGKKLSFKVLPLTFKSVFNPQYPTYSNDGIIASQVGNQHFLTGGLSLNSKWLSIQLSPELLRQNVRSFSPISWGEDLTLWENAYVGWNRSEAIPSGIDYMDLTANLGQSFILINLSKLSLGISNANNFWGPGQFHSLILSNHSAGFIHTSLHSNSTINVFNLFHLDFQFVNGFLNNRNDSLPYPTQQFDQNPFVKSKRNERRYLSGFNISVNPKFLRGLYIGFNRSIQQYWSDAQNFNNYLPAFDLFFRGKDDGRDDREVKDQILSASARWVVPRNMFEVYYVYGRNDAAWNFRDFIMSPQHSMSSLYGISKIIKRNESRFIQISIESVKMSQSINRWVRNATTWYWHWQVTQGMTNDGAALGAALPLGSNQQILDFSTFSDIKNLGVRLSRTTVDEEFVKTYISQTDSKKRWIQFSSELYGIYPVKEFLFSANLTLSHHSNFQYVLDKNKIMLNSQFSISWILR